MPRLTNEELISVINEGQAARAQKARALASAVRAKGFFTYDDIRQFSLLRGEFIPFMNSVMTPLAVPPSPPPPPPPASKPKQPPLWLAALSACGVSALTSLTLLTAAAFGRWL